MLREPQALMELPDQLALPEWLETMELPGQLDRPEQRGLQAVQVQIVQLMILNQRLPTPTQVPENLD